MTRIAPWNFPNYLIFSEQFRRSRTLENFAMIHRVPHKPSTILRVSRYACEHALRKAHDSSNETYNRAICINDAPPDFEPVVPPCVSHPPLSSSASLLLPLYSSLAFLAPIYRFCTIAPLDADTACDHVCRLVISFVKKKIDFHGNITYIGEN